MGESEIDREIDELGRLISSLEEAAGITNASEQARENGSPDKLRDAYYSVTDNELRKKLIVTTGRLDQLFLKKCELDVSTARNEVSIAIEKSKKPSWHIVAASWAGAAVIGYWALGLLGAMGGSLIGYFLGEWVSSVIKKDDSREIEQTKLMLISAQKRDADSRIDPYLFSAAEQQGSERER